MSVLSKFLAYDITVVAGVIYVNLPETGPDDHDPLTDEELDRIRFLIGENGDVGAVVVRGDDDWKVCQVTEEIKLHFMGSGLSPCVTQHCTAYIKHLTVWNGLVKKDQSGYGYTIFVVPEESVSAEKCGPYMDKDDMIKDTVLKTDVFISFHEDYSKEMIIEDLELEEEAEFVEELSVKSVDEHICNLVYDY